MLLEILLVKLILCINLIQAESFDERSRFGQTGSRSFVAPDLTEIQQLQPELGQLKPEDVPTLSEFNYYDSEVQRRLILAGLKRDDLMQNFHKDSEVTSSLANACRKCMIANNVQCISSICPLHINRKRSKVKDVHQQAFATGTSLHSDILCSLCKRTRDVMCTMRLCVDPERGQNAAESGVQCEQGFCRWQKEAVVNTGFNNYYHAWWQPQNLYFFFDHVTKEIASAYNEFIVSTSNAINGLG